MPPDRDVRSRLGQVGVWSMELRSADRPEAREAAAELDELGYSALWIPGLDGRGALDDVDTLLQATPRMTVAMGVLSIWGQDPTAIAARIRAIEDERGPRLVMGFGVSNREAASGAGEEYGNPVASVVASVAGYLARLDGAPSPSRPFAASSARSDQEWWTSPPAGPRASTLSSSPPSTARSIAVASARADPPGGPARPAGSTGPDRR